MSQSLSRGNVLQIGTFLPTEWTTRRGYPQLTYFTGIFAQKALVYGTMLGIDGHQHARLGCHGHDKGATHYQRLLIGKGKNLARAKRFIACLQTSSTHQGVHYHIGLFKMNHLTDRIRPKADASLCADKACSLLFQLSYDRSANLFWLTEGQMPHVEFFSLSQQFGTACACSQANDFQAIGMTARHIKRLNANGAR